MNNHNSRAIVVVRIADVSYVAADHASLLRDQGFREVRTRAGFRYEALVPGRSSTVQQSPEVDLLRRIAQLRGAASTADVKLTIELVIWLGYELRQFSMTGPYRQWIEVVDEIWCETDPLVGSVADDRLTVDIMGKPEMPKSFRGTDSLARQEWFDHLLRDIVGAGDLVSVDLASGGGTVGVILTKDLLNFLATQSAGLRLGSNSSTYLVPPNE